MMEKFAETALKDFSGQDEEKVPSTCGSYFDILT